MKEIRIAMLGMVDGNGHPYSWSAMFNGYNKESAKRKTEIMKETLRHEIVHAFFNESGLMESSNQYSGAWAHNEELVDWIALQGGKIYKAWKEAGAI